MCPSRSLQLVLAVAGPIAVVEVVDIDAINKAGFGVALLVLAVLGDGGRGAGDGYARHTARAIRIQRGFGNNF